MRKIKLWWWEFKEIWIPLIAPHVLMVMLMLSMMLLIIHIVLT